MNSEHNPNLIELKSVGSWLDNKECILYPMMSNGEYFEYEGISLKDDEVSMDWYEGLSDKDYDVVDTVLKDNNVKMGDFDTCDDYNYGYGA